MRQQPTFHYRTYQIDGAATSIWMPEEKWQGATYLSRMIPLELPCRPDVQASFEAVMKDCEPLILLGAVAAGKRAWRKFREGPLLTEALKPFGKERSSSTGRRYAPLAKEASRY